MNCVKPRIDVVNLSYMLYYYTNFALYTIGATLRLQRLTVAKRLVWGMRRNCVLVWRLFSFFCWGCEIQSTTASMIPNQTLHPRHWGNLEVGIQGNLRNNPLSCTRRNNFCANCWLSFSNLSTDTSKTWGLMLSSLNSRPRRPASNPLAFCLWSKMNLVCFLDLNMRNAFQPSPLIWFQMILDVLQGLGNQF